MLVGSNYDRVRIIAMNTASLFYATSRSRLRILTIRVIATIALLSLAYLGAWAGTAILLFHKANEWVESQRRAGQDIQHGEPIFGGFPEKVVITYPGVSIASGDLPADWAWSALRP